ncbi:ABC transporter permease subunit [Undibacterium sp. TJN25]|uniref:ABC transporter permease subunit n=1 Tax=Undibacterium sp. TJN25 TaxID=3413056 RepID=UPI003BF14133
MNKTINASLPAGSEAPGRAMPPRAIWMLAAALVFLVVSSFVLPAFLVNNLIRAFLFAAVALTVDLLWGYTGILTFGQSAFFGIGAYAAGLVFQHYGFSPLNAVLAFVGGLVASWIVSRIISWLAFYHGASPLYASVVTLVLPIVLVQGIYSGGEFTGSSSGLSGFDSFDIPLETWYLISGIFLVLLTLGAWLFTRSDAGKLLVATRENEARCEYLGINISRLKTRLMSVSSLIAAAAGFLFACVQMVVAPEYADFVFGTELVIWVALGGRGTLFGPVIATIMIDVGSAYLSGDLPYIWKLLVGSAFVLVIVAMPRGLMPLLTGALHGLRMRVGKNAPQHLQEASPLPFQAKHESALALNEVSKHFGSLSVLNGITFSARPGELLSIVGPNGAGKTTLMRCISDGAESSSGTIHVNGVSTHSLPPDKCVTLGIGRKFQTATTFDSLTVAEALRIARTRIEKPDRWRRSHVLKLPKATLDVLRATGLDKELERECRILSHGQKQALELAMVLALEPRVLLLDEPTAGLTKPERTLIGSILIDLSNKYGLCLLLVEHDLDFVRAISSRIVVLHQGKIVMDGKVDEVVGSEIVRTVYAGANQHMESAP